MKLVQKLLPPGPVGGGRSLLQAPILTAVLLPTQLPGDGLPHQDKVCGKEQELAPTPWPGRAVGPRAVPIPCVPLLQDSVLSWGWALSCKTRSQGEDMLGLEGAASHLAWVFLAWEAGSQDPLLAWVEDCSRLAEGKGSSTGAGQCLPGLAGGCTDQSWSAGPAAASSSCGTGGFPHPPQHSRPQPAPSFSPRRKGTDPKDQPFSLTYPRTAVAEDISCALLAQGCVAGLEVKHMGRCEQ